MPMIDVYATEGTFADKHALAQNLAAAVMRWERVPDLALFRDNSAAFVHDLAADSIANVVGDSNYRDTASSDPRACTRSCRTLAFVNDHLRGSFRATDYTRRRTD
jgi:hypothetical protein